MYKNNKTIKRALYSNHFHLVEGNPFQAGKPAPTTKMCCIKGRDLMGHGID